MIENSNFFDFTILSYIYCFTQLSSTQILLSLHTIEVSMVNEYYKQQ